MSETIAQLTIEKPADAELVRRARLERAEFEPLYARYVDRVYRYCYRRLGSVDDAADATSQVFAKALAGIDRCQPESFRSWLFAIAHNVLIDRHRTIRPDQPLETAHTQPTTDPSPEEHALAVESMSNVERMLSHLNGNQRQIVELRLAGLTSKEIATAMGMTPNAVDQAQFRAVTRLRTIFAGATERTRS